ncbi:20S proteasome subunit [Mycena olivaceomarginata]|nr:20S proteasome subunit [Mycena olivaceomarginata]
MAYVLPSAGPSARGVPQQRQMADYPRNCWANFSVIAGDTRQSEGYNIQTRYAPKVFRLTDKAVLATNGFAADGNMFVKKGPPVKRYSKWYHMSLHAIARLIQSMLYQRRFFPLLCVREAVYSFDPVGSYERETCRAARPSSDLLQNQTAPSGSAHPTHLPLAHVLSLVIDSFTSAMSAISSAYTNDLVPSTQVGDGLEMYVVLAKGSPLQGLDTIQGITELTSIPGGRAHRD